MIDSTKVAGEITETDCLYNLWDSSGKKVLGLYRPRHGTVNARELPAHEGALVLRDEIKSGNPFSRYYGITPNSSSEDFERAATLHPVFELEAASQASYEPF